MIGTIRKHSTWLWAIIITVVIVTFVFWGSQQSRLSNSPSAGNYGSINNKRISRDEYGDAQREVYLQYFFSSGQWPEFQAEQIMRETYYRLLLINKLEDFDIHIRSEAVAKEATAILRSINRGKPAPLDAFVEQVLRPQGLAAADLARFIRHYLGIQELVAAVGLGGKLVTAQEGRALYEREHQELSAEAVFFSASNRLEQVQPTVEEVGRFYTNQMTAYRLPERVQVTYVQFSASNFIAEAEREVDQTPNLAERIEANYQRLGGTNFFRSAKSPEEAKEMIRKEFIKDEALKTARKQAYDFANKLDSIQPVSSENLEKLAAKMNFAAQLSEPFDRQYPPSDLKVRADFNKQAFTLTAEEPFGGPIVGEDAAFVIALSKRLPSETPTFDEIRARVTKDCRFNQAVMRARRDGSTFAAVLAAGLPNGKSFAALCVEAKVHPVALPPFSLSTRSFPEVEQHASLVQFKQAAFSAAPGKASEFVETDEGGFVVFVQSKLPVDESKLRADLPQYMGYVRRAREGEAFNDWFRREADRGLRDTPLARRQPTAGGIPTE